MLAAATMILAFFRELDETLRLGFQKVEFASVQNYQK